ncbi:MAG TPA: hypothetical protein VKP67_22390 [Xanthobacteraceae bacterium]|nr:hypothetical protein [Xanthobacteraceae bacterium]
MSQPASPASGQTTATGKSIEVRSSRVWALLRGRFTEFLFPSRLSTDQLGITLVKVDFWLTPWTRNDEHLPMSHLAEVAHDRGLVWDSISIESSGGLNPLKVDGLPKRGAKQFVDRVRTWMNA